MRVDVPLDIALDRHAEVPLGVQLAWALRARILSGELTVGHRLPGVRELAAATEVNANTVRAVYARLEAEGLVTAEHGRGTFVSRSAKADGRLGDVARTALAAARDAGLDPREVAAALYTGAGGTEDDEAAERRRLRDEIARLERELADAELTRRMGARQDDAIAAASPRRRGRILATDELRAARDDLAGRLRLLREAEAVEEVAEAPEAPAPESASSSATRSATGPQPVGRWSFGA